MIALKRQGYSAAAAFRIGRAVLSFEARVRELRQRRKALGAEKVKNACWSGLEWLQLSWIFGGEVGFFWGRAELKIDDRKTVIGNWWQGKNGERPPPPLGEREMMSAGYAEERFGQDVHNTGFSWARFGEQGEENASRLERFGSNY